MINPDNPDFSLYPAHPLRKNAAYNLTSWNNLPSLTIITPFYNTGPVFYETAQSIFMQSFQQWEWLIINDGSTDEQALHILEKYRHCDPRVRVIDHNENRGLSAARNTGFSYSRCEYVLMLDSDDLLEPTAAEKWWWYLDTHDQYSFVASYHVAFGGLNYLWTGGFHDGSQNAERNRVSMMCMIRKSVHQAVGGFDETIRGGLEDWDFWMRCANQGYWGATIPEFLAWYRLRRDHSDRWKNLTETRLNEFRTTLKNKYPNLYQGGFPSIIEKVDHDLTTIDMDIPPINQLVKTGTHLLFILPWLAMGGAERFTLNLMDQLAGQGWTFSIVTTAKSKNPWRYEFDKRATSVFILPDFIPIKDYPRFLGYLIQSRGFDAILIQGSLEGYRLIPILRAMVPKIPILDYLHFVTPDWMQGGYPKLSLLYKDFIDFSFTSCNQLRDWMVKEGGEPERIHVCYLGVDPEIWKPDITKREQTRTERKIGNNEIVILYSARLEEQKQPDVFVDTLNKVAQKGGKFYALVAGEGSLMKQLKEKLHAYGLLDLVQLLGKVPADKMPALMAASDIFFLPSKNEGISQALYEAMASGLIVVSARVGGQSELVSPDCGFLIDPTTKKDETAEYSSILDDLLGNPPKMEQMSLASRERILANFTLKQMGECISKGVDKIAESKNNTKTQPISEQENRSIHRETQTVVEYLQARERLQWLSQQYSELITPKPPSHWFYLWIRQIFLPVSTFLKSFGLGGIIVAIQQKLKRLLIND